MSKKYRKTGDILLDLEILIDELVDQELQMGDILALVRSHIEIHRPDAIEEYTDGTNPVFYYGVKK